MLDLLSLILVLQLSNRLRKNLIAPVFRPGVNNGKKFGL